MSEIHYIDTHTHLMGEEFKEDLEDVIRRTEENHVDRIMIITLNAKEAEAAIAFAKRDPHNSTQIILLSVRFPIQLLVISYRISRTKKSQEKLKQ